MQASVQQQPAIQYKNCIACGHVHKLCMMRAIRTDNKTLRFQQELISYFTAIFYGFRLSVRIDVWPCFHHPIASCVRIAIIDIIVTM